MKTSAAEIIWACNRGDLSRGETLVRRAMPWRYERTGRGDARYDLARLEASWCLKTHLFIRQSRSAPRGAKSEIKPGREIGNDIATAPSRGGSPWP